MTTFDPYEDDATFPRMLTDAEIRQLQAIPPPDGEDEPEGSGLFITLEHALRFADLVGLLALVAGFVVGFTVGRFA